MKIDHRDRKPLVEKRTKPGFTENPESIEARCRRENVKVSPSTIRGRMKKWDMTFEEAVAYVPKTRSECGRAAKKNSRWGKNVPADSEEYKLRQGQKLDRNPRY